MSTALGLRRDWDWFRFAEGDPSGDTNRPWLTGSRPLGPASGMEPAAHELARGCHPNVESKAVDRPHGGEHMGDSKTYNYPKANSTHTSSQAGHGSQVQGRKSAPHMKQNLQQEGTAQT